MPYCRLLEATVAQRAPSAREVFLPAIPAVGDLIIIDRCYVVEAVSRSNKQRRADAAEEDTPRPVGPAPAKSVSLRVRRV